MKVIKGILLLLCLGSASCATPRIEDALAPSQYREAAQPHALCTPEVELVRTPSLANRPYREVANLSATCYPGAPTVCERQLLDRACELRANAIILIESRADGTPIGGTKDSRVEKAAIAVKWTDPQPAP